MNIGFIPETRAKYILVGSQTPNSFINDVQKLGVEVIKVKPLKSVNKMVSGHTDIMIFPLENNKFVIAKEFNIEIKEKLIKVGCELTEGSSLLTCNYPFDIAYNVARVGNYAFHRINYTDNKIKEYLFEKEVEIIDVKQGYTKCSTCIVSENAIITSDKSIEKAAKSLGIDVLLIKEGGIRLEGAKWGFIGGATGLIDKNTLISCGKIERHPDFNMIQKFCNKHKVNVLGVGNIDIIDIGSIIAITK